jgi:hypothetical protein
MNITQIPLSEIKPYANNPRKNKKGIAAVKLSIEEFGFTQPLIVNGERVILCGHTRYEAAKELNFEAVPVIVKTDLTPQQERAYRIADNRVTQETDWDKWKLRSEFNELFSDGDYFTGFTQEEVSDIMAMDLGFRNDREMDTEMPARIYPREIACDEEQDAMFDRVQTLMGKKKDVDVVMELCEMFLVRRSQESEVRRQ